jgi:CrcB protein
VLILLIAAAGGAGSVCRYLVGRAMAVLVGPSWPPAGTMTVNLAGCFLIGLLAGVATHRSLLSPATRTVLTTGFLGGFTTFSAFGFESVTLAREGQAGAALLNVLAQVGFGLAACWLGLLLGERL